MIPIGLIKFAGNRIYKAIKHNRELKKIEEYVNKPNELDLQIKAHEKRIKKLEKDSHPPQEYICCRKCGCEIAKTKKGEK